MAISKSRSQREYDKFGGTTNEDTFVRTALTAGDGEGVLLESGQVSPGASANGYDVKTTGGLFSTVTTSTETSVENLDSAETITVYPNTDNTNPITIGPGVTKTINLYGVTNLFIDTTASHSGAVEITLIGS